MATLKLGPTGKIALCGSGAMRVSCCPSTACCLYPPSDGIVYPYTDLPNPLTDVINGGTFDRVGPTTVTADVDLGSGSQGSADITLLYESSSTGFFIGWVGTNSAGLDPNGWFYAFLDSGNYTIFGSTEDTCLIVTGFIEDQFPDTLTMSFAGYDTVVTRISNCEWTGLDLCGNTWRVWYGDIDGGVDYKWSANAFQFDFGSGIDCPNSEGFSPSQKDDPQSSPIGTYDNGPATFIVSA